MLSISLRLQHCHERQEDLEDARNDSHGGDFAAFPCRRTLSMLALHSNNHSYEERGR